MVKLFPSLIAANLLNLERVIHELEPSCDGYHIDVMDFHFVPNLTLGPDFVNAIRSVTSRPVQVHLMVDYPENYFDRLQLHPDDTLCIHGESPSAYSIAQLCAQIRAKKLRPSLAINHETPLEALIQVPTHLEQVLLMSVHPGFSGQELLPFALDKLKALDQFRKAHNSDFTITVDGGVKLENYQELINNGADELVIGSGIFGFEHYVDKLKEFRSA